MAPRDRLLDELSGPVSPRPLAKASRESGELELRSAQAQADELEAELRQESSSEAERLARAADQSEFCAAFKATGMSRRAFARYCGVSHTFIEDILEGARDVTPRVLRRMPPAAQVRWAQGFLKSAKDGVPSAAGWR